MPQSVHFIDQDKLETDCEIFKKHRDLHVFLRDENSLSILKNKNVPNLALCPDMAHALWGKIKATKTTEISKLYLLRKDGETAALPADILDKQAQSFDWSDFLKELDMFFLYQLGYQTDRIDGRLLDNCLPALAIWTWAADRFVNKAIDLFSRHEMIVFNRLHAMILSPLLQKKAVMYDNSYGKVSSYADLMYHFKKSLSVISFFVRRRA